MVSVIIRNIFFFIPESICKGLTPPKTAQQLRCKKIPISLAFSSLRIISNILSITFFSNVIWISLQRPCFELLALGLGAGLKDSWRLNFYQSCWVRRSEMLWRVFFQVRFESVVFLDIYIKFIFFQLCFETVIALKSQLFFISTKLSRADNP